jgi:hypothetical protein
MAAGRVPIVRGQTGSEAPGHVLHERRVRDDPPLAQMGIRILPVLQPVRALFSAGLSPIGPNSPMI